MRQIVIADINRRLRSLSAKTSASNQNNTFSEGARLIINKGRAYDIKRFIESAGKSTSEVSFTTIMELFDALTDVGTISDISKMGHYIAEDVIHKVRDAKSTESLIKRRMTRLQHKLAPSTTVPAGPKPIKPVQKTNVNKEKAIKEAYENMLESAIINRNCDRVLENYNRISKRFNLEIVINENTRANGVKDTVIELCNRIDTYDMPTAVKFNTVIETAFYGFESNFITYNKSDIIEAAIDYFAFKEDGLAAAREILDATLFYNKNEDMGNVDILTEEEPEDDSKPSSVDTVITKHYGKDTVQPVKEASDFSEMFDKFKQEELAKDGKPEMKLRTLVIKLYSRNVDSIVEGTPNLLSWIRSFFIIGSFAVPVIGPVIAIVGFIADRFIALHMDIKETEKMIQCFSNEIRAANKKLESTTNPEDKDKLEKYIDSLKKAKEKISMYRMDLTDDFEVEGDYNDMADGDEFDFGDFGEDDDFDFGDDMDFSFDEMANAVASIVDTNANPITETTMYLLPKKLSDDLLYDMTNVVKECPDLFFKEAFIDGLNQEIARIRNSGTRGVAEIIRINIIENMIQDLNTAPHKEITSKNIIRIHHKYSAIAEAYTAVNMIRNMPEDHDETVLEASFTNTLKLASMKLKNAIKNLTDKEKSISKSVDVSMNNVMKGAERAMTTDNREAIIKGSILPSASKIIKMAIINAGLIAIHQPAIAVIGTLAYLACSKAFKAKERQMLIDEIEIEIEMCDKYIQIAESKNDMKALKQLMTTKRELTRQLQRIKFNMKAKLGQKYYDAKNVGDK